MRAVPHEPTHRLGAACGCALAVAGVGLFFTNVDGYAYTEWGGPAPIRLVLVFAAAAAALVLANLRRPMPLLRSPVLAWTVAYLLVTTAWAIWTPAVPEVVQELRDRYRSILLLLTFMVVFDEPRARRAALVAVAVAVAICSLLNVAEFLSLVTFADTTEHRTAGRAAAFHVNPNAAGLAIAFGSAVAVPAIPRWLRAPLLLLAVCGVVATFSRGAAMCLALALVVLVVTRKLGKGWVAAALAAGFVLLTYASEYVTEHHLLDANTAARVRLEHHDSERVALATKAWDVFASSPVVGSGLASTVTWDVHVRAHNTVLTLAADHGVLGLILFPVLGLALLASRRGSAPFALALMAAGFTSHTMLDSRYALLLIALAAARGGERVHGGEVGAPALEVNDDRVARAS